MKLTIRHPPPRTPLGAAAHGRRAGAHRPSPGGQRQQFKHALRRELVREPVPRP